MATSSVEIDNAKDKKRGLVCTFNNSTLESQVSKFGDTSDFVGCRGKSPVIESHDRNKQISSGVLFNTEKLAA